MSTFSDPEEMKLRMDAAEDRFENQDADMADIVEELTSMFDTYTPEGGNLLGKSHVAEVSEYASKSLVSKPHSPTEEMVVRGFIVLRMASGEFYKITVEREK